MLHEKILRVAPRLNKEISNELPNVNVIKTVLISTYIHVCILLNTVCSMIALLLSFMVSALSTVHSVFDGFKINFQLTLIKRP